jgi:hypothetical protein
LTASQPAEAKAVPLDAKQNAPARSALRMLPSQILGIAIPCAEL